MKRNTVRLLLRCLGLVSAAGLAAAAGELRAGVGETVHNLSVSGPGEIRATREERICIFCHAPHRATPQPPLWNRRDSRASYLSYESPTLDALVDQPTGASRMCLSCHDGTIALGEVASEPEEIELNQPFLDPDTGSLTTDLADDHPISFVYGHDLVGEDPELVDPLAILAPVRLDAGGEMQCTSCHDPHDDTLGSFLLLDPFAGALCIACHRKDDWELGAHATSDAVWDGTPPEPWPGSDDPTVAGNACGSCHTPHTAAQPRWLVRRAPEEEGCLVCHNAHVAGRNLEAEFAKPYRHPLELAEGVHEPGEDPWLAPRHVECTDCHEPHEATGTPPAGAPAASGALRGVRGIDAAGEIVDPVRFQYEVCFTCHGDATDTDQEIPRSAGEINVRLELAADAVSYHPVVQAGRNPHDPSLRPPYTETSLIYCTDCHASESADSGGARGPHGSEHRGLLRRRYETEDRTAESPLAYDLCYGCHSRTVLLGARSGFAAHRLHVVDQRTSCSVCHDPHGVASGVGQPDANTHLLSFDLRSVEPNARGELRFEDRGAGAGACYLRCHDSGHDPKEYR